MTEARPAFDLDQNNPGSDALGQAAAALAAISIIYETVDAGYALLLEAHARDLYACARAPRTLMKPYPADAPVCKLASLMKKVCTCAGKQMCRASRAPTCANLS